MAKKLTRELLEEMVTVPGLCGPEPMAFIGSSEPSQEELENYNAAYRVKYLHEDIDTVLAEVNAKRGDDEKPEDLVPDLGAEESSGASSKNLLADLFGDSTLQDVEIEYQGMKIRIGYVDLRHS